MRPRCQPTIPWEAVRGRHSPKPKSADLEEGTSSPARQAVRGDKLEARPCARVQRDLDPRRLGWRGEDPTSRLGGPNPLRRDWGEVLGAPPPASSRPARNRSPRARGGRGGRTPSRRRAAPWGPKRKAQTSACRPAPDPRPPWPAPPPLTHFGLHQFRRHLGHQRPPRREPPSGRRFSTKGSDWTCTEDSATAYFSRISE